jgi:hypothetical protein
MSENKPNVFPTKENENQEKPLEMSETEKFRMEAERLAAELMQVRTEKQILERNMKKTTPEIEATVSNIQTPNPINNKPEIKPETENPKKSEPVKGDLGEPQFEDEWDMVELPSKGKIYPTKKSRIKVAFLTADDENILSNPGLIENGDFIEVLINRKVLEPELRYKNLHTGDKNAIMMWLRKTGYGKDYPVTLTNQTENGIESFDTVIDLTTVKYKYLDTETDDEGLIEYKLPVSGDVVKFRFLTNGDVDEIEYLESEGETKLVTITLTKHIVEVNGERNNISEYVRKMRAGDSRALRNYIREIESGVDMNVTVETPGGESISTFLPITPRFFWPDFGL